MANHESDTPNTEYVFCDPYQLQYLMRSAEKHSNDLEVTVIPTDTPEQIEAAATEWSDHEQETYHDYESAFDYLRRTDRTSYDELLKRIPAMSATNFLIKEVKRNKDVSTYKLMRDYYEPTEPKPQEEIDYGNKVIDLWRTFGQDGSQRLTYQIAHDNPALDKIEVVRHAWSLIPEAVAYQQPSTPEDLAERAILIHEGYEAWRRIAE